MISCPNKRLKAWKDLVKSVGEDKAYLLWDEHEGNVPNEYYGTTDIIEPIGEVGSTSVNFADLTSNSADPLFSVVNTHSDADLGNITDLLFNGNTGNIRVDQILSNISANVPGLTAHAAELAFRAAKLMSKSKAKVVLVSEDKMADAGTVMQYDSDTQEIQMSLDRLQKFDSKVAVVAFLHEVVHSLTVDALMKKPADRTFAEQELADVVAKFMNKYKNSSLAKEYGFTDEFEFVAEFYSNPEFRDKVKAESDNLWKQLVAAVRRYFNLGANKEYQELFDTIINFTEGEAQDFQGIRHYDRVFAKEADFKKPELRSLEDKLNYLVGVTQDRISQARARVNKSTIKRTKKEKKAHLKDIDTLLSEMDALSETQKWKVILKYTETLARTVYQVESGMKRLHDKTLDYRKDNLIPLIENYESYLSAYDLIKEINDLLGESRTEMKNLTPEEQADITEIRRILNYAAGQRDSLLSEFKAIKNQQIIKEMAKPEYNTQVETDHRNRLSKEYVEKGISGEPKIEYIARMLATRDKDLYEADLIASAEKIVANPSFDISAFKKNWSDPLNTSSKIIQILTNMLQSTRDKIIGLYKEYDMGLNKLYKDLVAEKGNKPPSQLYKDIYEQDKDGNYFFKGVYSIKFRDLYLEEFKPMENELLEMAEKLREQGLLTRTQQLVDEDYKELDTKVRAWMREHTVKDPHDVRGKRWYPKPKYRNVQPTGASAAMLKEALAVLNMGHKDTNGNASLIRKAGEAKFYKFPSMSKSDFERTIEKDFKGIISQKKAELVGVRPDDIGVEKGEAQLEEEAKEIESDVREGEAVDTKGQVIKGVKVHFRGKIDPEHQSLDVATMLRKEFLNVTNYREKKKIETNVLLLADISKNKQYLQKSKKTGMPLMNVFNKNQQAVLVPGEFTNEFARIQGLIERNLYDTMSEHGGKFLGLDVNRLTDYANGLTASIAMSFNIASGTANVFNGFTQLFIESFGADTFNVKSLLKAEKRYTLELPKTLADMANPTKTSFVNQMNEMYDVFGGFDPATQEYIRNSIAKKLATRQSMNGLNEMGEHAMNSIVTMAVLDGLKVMNSNHKFIDKEGKETTEDKAASLLDMLKMDDKGKLIMDSKVKFTKHNLTVEYDKGGKTHVNLLIKNKVFDLFGVYDINFKNEVSKTWLGKSVMMFKNYFLSAMAYRYTGVTTAFVKGDDLTEDDLNYSSAKKEYIEGTYTSLLRYFRHGVIPALKSLQLMYMKDVYNGLSEHERANLKKATIEIVLTSVIIPAIGALLAAGAGDDNDDELWFWVYEFRRLESELSQFRNPIEASKVVSNPIAALKLIQNSLKFVYEVATPVNAVPGENEHVFSYLDEDTKGDNKLAKKAKKIFPVWSQLGRDWHQMHSLIDK